MQNIEFKKLSLGNTVTFTEPRKPGLLQILSKDTKDPKIKNKNPSLVNYEFSYDFILSEYFLS